MQLNIRKSPVSAGIRCAAAILVLAACAHAAKTPSIEDFDPNMALKQSVVTKGVRWIDGKNLPIEGRVFNNVDHFYDRLPSTVTKNVNGGVRSMKHHTAGMQIRFTTDSKKLHFKWVPYFPHLDMHHMPATGVSGIDVYRMTPEGKWRYFKTGGITNPKGGSLSIDWTPGTPCLVNLPLYNGIKSFTLGIDENAKISAPPPHRGPTTKPVVFYGTSITHGGCCSRPGMAFVNIVGRDLDVPVVDLGFSGSGKMEFEMSEHLASIDASCYVLDCVWNMRNMNMKQYSSLYEAFIRNLRAKRPDVPIVMAEMCYVYDTKPNEKETYMRGLYKKLIAEGWKNLVYLPKDNMFYLDGEGTVDGCHPNDWGMMAMAKAYGEAVLKALKR